MASKSPFLKHLRRLDTTWNFAHSITRVSTHELEHWEHCVQFTTRFGTTHFINCFSARRHLANQELSIAECDVTGMRGEDFPSLVNRTVLQTFSMSPKSTGRGKPPQQQALGAFHLYSPPCYVTYRDRHFDWQDGCERKKLVKWVVQKPFFFSKLCVLKQSSQCSSSCVATLVILQAKFNVVSSLLSDFDVIIAVPLALPLKMILTWKR